MLYQLSYSRLSGGYYMIQAVHPQLFFREWGSGYPVVVLHGLFGASDNWATVSKLLAERYRVIAVDLRNHGLSFHSPIHRYPDIAADIARLLDDLGIISASVIGHSMGGKVAMQFAADFPDMIDRLVVVDILPFAYEPHHDDVFAGLKAVPLGQIRRRPEAESAMEPYVHDHTLRLFLLKSLGFRLEDGSAYWKFNLDGLMSEYLHIVAAPLIVTPVLTPSLFIMGGLSEYRVEEGDRLRRALFLNSEIEVIPNAGHWVHGQYPERVAELVFSHVGE